MDCKTVEVFFKKTKNKIFFARGWKYNVILLGCIFILSFAIAILIKYIIEKNIAIVVITFIILVILLIGTYYSFCCFSFKSNGVKVSKHSYEDDKKHIVYIDYKDINKFKLILKNEDGPHAKDTYFGQVLYNRSDVDTLLILTNSGKQY